MTNANHGQIANFLADLSNDEVIEVGVRLGLNYTRLKDASNPRHDMVSAWLRKDDSVLMYSGHPTWESLRDVLMACGHTGIAERIANEGSPCSPVTVHSF